MSSSSGSGSGLGSALSSIADAVTPAAGSAVGASTPGIASTPAPAAGSDKPEAAPARDSKGDAPAPAPAPSSGASSGAAAAQLNAQDLETIWGAIQKILGKPKKRSDEDDEEEEKKQTKQIIGKFNGQVGCIQFAMNGKQGELFSAKIDWPKNADIAKFSQENKADCQKILDWTTTGLDFAEKLVKFLPDKYQKGATELINKARNSVAACQKVLDKPTEANINAAKTSCEATVQQGVKLGNQVFDDTMKVMPKSIQANVDKALKTNYASGGAEPAAGGTYDADAPSKFTRDSAFMIANNLKTETPGAEVSRGDRGSYTVETDKGEINVDAEGALSASVKDADAMVEAAKIAYPNNVELSVQCPQDNKDEVKEKFEAAGKNVEVKSNSEVEAEAQAAKESQPGAAEPAPALEGAGAGPSAPAIEVPTITLPSFGPGG